MKENPCNGLQSLSKSVLSSLSGLILTVFVTHSVPSTQMALLFLELPRHSPTLGSPHLLFPQPAKALPIYSCDLFTFFSSLFNCHISVRLYLTFILGIIKTSFQASTPYPLCVIHVIKKKKKNLWNAYLSYYIWHLFITFSLFWNKNILRKRNFAYFVHYVSPVLKTVLFIYQALTEDLLTIWTNWLIKVWMNKLA